MCKDIIVSPGSKVKSNHPLTCRRSGHSPDTPCPGCGGHHSQPEREYSNPTNWTAEKEADAAVGAGEGAVGGEGGPRKKKEPPVYTLTPGGPAVVVPLWDAGKARVPVDEAVRRVEEAAGRTDVEPALTKREIETRPVRPIVPYPDYQNIPPELKAIPNWVVWRYDWDEERGAWTKVLYDVKTLRRRDGRPAVMWCAASNKPRTWTTYEDALGFVLLNQECGLGGGFGRWGLGFVLREGEDVTVLDLDDCRNRNTGEITYEAQTLIDQFATYTEVSPSGTGVKLYLLGKKPGTRVCSKREFPGIEIFGRVKFVAITGDHLAGTPATMEPRQDELTALYRQMFPEDEETSQRPARTPRSQSNVPGVATPAPALEVPDEVVLERIRASAQAAKFERLMAGDCSDYASANNAGRSEADLGLFSILAKWTRGNAAQMERIAWQSHLPNRLNGKWDRADYLGPTIRKAIAGRQNSDPLADELGDIPTDLTWVSPRRKEPDPEAPTFEQVVREVMPRLLAQVEEAERARPRPQTEEDVALHTAVAQADLEEYPCTCCERPLIQADRETNQPFVQWRRGLKGWCDGCRRFRIDRELWNAEFRFQGLTTVWVYALTRENREATLKRLNRARAQWREAPNTGEYELVLFIDRDVGLGMPQTPEQALDILRTCLEDWDGEQRISGTSRGWKRARRSEPSRYRLLGLGSPGLTTADIQEIAQGEGVGVRFSTPRGASETLRVASFALPQGEQWTPERLERLTSLLGIGEPVPDLDLEWETPGRHGYTSMEEDLAPILTG